MKLLFLALICFSTSVFAQGTRPNGDLLIEPSGEVAVDMGRAIVGQTRLETLVVTNVGQSAKHSMVGTLLNPHYRFAGLHYPGVGGTCTKTLALEASCTIVIEFRPQSVGLKRSLVRLNYWSGPRPETSYRVIEGEGL